MSINGPAIDLEQLAVRESEQIEWKQNVADVDDVVRTLSAFANDIANLGGGYVVCGATEEKDENGFQKLVKSGLTANRLKEIEGQVLQKCRDLVAPSIVPLVHELPSDDPAKRMLIFVQPSTGQAHAFRQGGMGTVHWVRLGRETREARNGVLRELLVRKGAQEPWDRRPCAGATVEDLDLLALRDALQRMRVFSSDIGIEPYLSDERQLSPFVPTLCVKDPLTNVLRPRNYAMLLFGRETQRFIPGAFSLFSIYPGIDRSDPHAERHEIAGTIFEQSRRLGELLDVQSFTTFDKTDPKLPNTVKYPKRALYEAMGNALAHRDYEQNDPVRLTVFEDRIEVLSPGALPFGVSLDAFREGKAAPKWRNQSLAWFFNRLQIAQAEGQGIPTILRSMKEEGCPPPTFEADDTRVLYILPSHPRHALFRELRDVEQNLGLGELSRAQNLVQDVLSRDPLNIRGLQLFAEVQTALRDPKPVLDLIEQHKNDLSRFPRAAGLQLAEAILSGENITDYQRNLASQLLRNASTGALEERELRRVGVALLRSRQEEAVIQLIETHLEAHPDWDQNPSIHQLWGDALTGLARRCRNAAGRYGLPQVTRERSRQQFVKYADGAEAHLNRAKSLSRDSGLSNVIQRNLDYLADLRRKAQLHAPRHTRP